VNICNVEGRYTASYILYLIRKYRLEVLLCPVTDFHQSWYGHGVTRYPTFVPLNFLLIPPVLPTLWYELLRWEW